MDGSIMLQEYLPGEEYSVDVYVRRDGRVIAAVPRDRMKMNFGIAVASRTMNMPDAMQSAIRTAEIVGIRGYGQRPVQAGGRRRVQVAGSQSPVPRLLPLTTAGPGIDMPKLMVAELMGQPVPDMLDAFQGTDGGALLDRETFSTPGVGGGMPPT